ncbi:MAG: hypothetical protein ACRDNX_13490 [Gaiellaceae bacterium]
MKSDPQKRLLTGIALLLGAGALAAPTAAAYPTDPEDGRLLVPMTSRTTAASAKPKPGKAAKPARRRSNAPARPKPPVEP